MQAAAGAIHAHLAKGQHSPETTELNRAPVWPDVIANIIGIMHPVTRARQWDSISDISIRFWYIFKFHSLHLKSNVLGSTCITTLLDQKYNMSNAYMRQSWGWDVSTPQIFEWEVVRSPCNIIISYNVQEYEVIPLSEVVT